MNWAAPFEELQLGAAFITAGRVVSDADVAAFAALTGDHHPVHTDAAWAAGSGFGEQIAHGLLVLSCAVGLVPLDPSRVVALRRISDAVFKRPVTFGEEIHVEGVVQELRAVGEEAGIVGCRWSIVNSRGQLCTRASVELLWRAGSRVEA